MSSPAPVIAICECKDKEKLEVILSEKAQLASATNIKAPLLNSGTLPPIISVPGANTAITRLRLSNAALNLVILSLFVANIDNTYQWWMICMYIIGIIGHIATPFELNHEIANGKKEAAELAINGDARAIAAANRVVMDDLRTMISKEWRWFAMSVIFTLVWVAVVVMSVVMSKGKIYYVALVAVLNAMEATTRGMVAVLMTRYRRTALEQGALDWA
ncbi:hypothetical protein DFP72DRAFT_868751 [Ephemerocybe angulata]|uniref:Uncharacterized protein n=1 Tax=Ephemerocybe angulata TaxID=980116 RepID=A0A8H6IHX6_9AGAR|nr:hypothetical protein DFP72DRAFT_868751 [Tulosesus angulatus]